MLRQLSIRDLVLIERADLDFHPGLVVLTGSLIPAIVLHVLIDVRTLVVIPVVVLEVHKPWSKRRSTARRRERAAAERAAARAEAEATPDSAG